jgi:hypothetical protein
MAVKSTKKNPNAPAIVTEANSNFKLVLSRKGEPDEIRFVKSLDEVDLSSYGLGDVTVMASERYVHQFQRNLRRLVKKDLQKFKVPGPL